MVFSIVVTCDQRLHKCAIEDSTTQGALAQYKLIDESAEWSAEPFADWHGETHLRTRQNCFRQQSLHAFPQNVLRGSAPQLEALRHCRTKLPQFLTKKRHSAFDRCPHTHLVLLHLQLIQIRLHVD